MVKVRLDQMIILLVLSMFDGVLFGYLVPTAFSVLKDGTNGLFVSLILFSGPIVVAFGISGLVLLAIKEGALLTQHN